MTYMSEIRYQSVVILVPVRLGWGEECSAFCIRYWNCTMSGHILLWPHTPFPLLTISKYSLCSLSPVAWVLVYSRPVSRGDRRRSDSIQSITSVYTDISKFSIACSRSASSALLQGFSSEENVSSHVIYRLATCTCHTNCISITYITTTLCPLMLAGISYISSVSYWVSTPTCISSKQSFMSFFHLCSNTTASYWGSFYPLLSCPSTVIFYCVIMHWTEGHLALFSRGVGAGYELQISHGVAKKFEKTKTHFSNGLQNEI